MRKMILSMYNSNNITYILTILEAIEKVFYYTESFKDDEEFFHANKQLNFECNCQPTHRHRRRKQKNRVGFKNIYKNKLAKHISYER